MLMTMDMLFNRNDIQEINSGEILYEHEIDFYKHLSNLDLAPGSLAKYDKDHKGNKKSHVLVGTTDGAIVAFADFSRHLNKNTWSAFFPTAMDLEFIRKLFDKYDLYPIEASGATALFGPNNIFLGNKNNE